MRRDYLLILSLAGGMAGCANLDAAPPTPAAGHRASLAIRVTARQYAWTFEYPGGGVSEELHVPVDCQVTLVLTSRDVIHALQVAAFGIKEDAVPGRESRCSFRAPNTGSFEALCAEFCGPGHSRCRAKVVVHESAVFERWLVSNKPK